MPPDGPRMIVWSKFTKFRMAVEMVRDCDQCRFYASGTIVCQITVEDFDAGIWFKSTHWLVKGLQWLSRSSRVLHAPCSCCSRVHGLTVSALHWSSTRALQGTNGEPM